MPYIVDELKEKIDPEMYRIAYQINKLEMDDREGPSNYAITRILCQVFDIEDEKVRYKYLNRAIGVLECVKQELYRRAGGPYEDQAIAKNGDIPEYATFGGIWQTAYCHSGKDTQILPEIFKSEEAAEDFLKYRIKYDGEYYAAKTEYFIVSPNRKVKIFKCD